MPASKYDCNIVNSYKSVRRAALESCTQGLVIIRLSYFGKAEEFQKMNCCERKSRKNSRDSVCFCRTVIKEHDHRVRTHRHQKRFGKRRLEFVPVCGIAGDGTRICRPDPARSQRTVSRLPGPRRGPAHSDGLGSAMGRGSLLGTRTVSWRASYFSHGPVWGAIS